MSSIHFTTTSIIKTPQKLTTTDRQDLITDTKDSNSYGKRWTYLTMTPSTYLGCGLTTTDIILGL